MEKIFVPILTSKFNYIPDNQPNKEFYRGKVCACERYGTDHMVEDIGYFENQRLLKNGTPHYFRMKCGGYDGQNYLSICPSCESVFYSLFTHPAQTETTNYNSTYGGQYCWHCLEAGLGPNYISWRYSHLPKTPPIPELLNPYVIPPTVLDRANSISSKLTKLDEMLLELKGVLNEHRQLK